VGDGALTKIDEQVTFIVRYQGIGLFSRQPFVDGDTFVIGNEDQELCVATVQGVTLLPPGPVDIFEDEVVDLPNEWHGGYRGNLRCSEMAITDRFKVECFDAEEALDNRLNELREELFSRL